MRRTSIGEKDEKEDDEPNERTAGAGLPIEPNPENNNTNDETESETTPSVTGSPPNVTELQTPQPSVLPPSTLSDAPVATIGSGPLSAKTSTPLTSVSDSASSSRTSSSPPSNQSLWRRIRRSRGHSDDGAWVPSTFIDSVLQRGKRGKTMA